MATEAGAKARALAHEIAARRGARIGHFAPDIVGQTLSLTFATVAAALAGVAGRTQTRRLLDDSVDRPLATASLAPFGRGGLPAALRRRGLRRRSRCWLGPGRIMSATPDNDTGEKGDSAQPKVHLLSIPVPFPSVVPVPLPFPSRLLG